MYHLGLMVHIKYVSHKISDTYLSTMLGPVKDYLYAEVGRVRSKIEIRNRI